MHLESRFGLVCDEQTPLPSERGGLVPSAHPIDQYESLRMTSRSDSIQCSSIFGVNDYDDDSFQDGDYLDDDSNPFNDNDDDISYDEYAGDSDDEEDYDDGYRDYDYDEDDEENDYL